MSSKSTLPYATRAKNHLHPVARRLFDVAEAKKSNVIISADMGTTEELLKLADQLGPYIAVFKTHIDLLSDFSDNTISGLKDLAAKHNFMIFEDRKFIDIGHTVQQQYHGGALRISEFAHVVNASVLAGDGIIEALEQTMAAPNFLYKDERAMLILSEMTTAGSLATGDYTRKHKKSVTGFVATQALTHFRGSEGGEDEDFVIFTTGVNATAKGDSLGQQYQTPSSAISRGSDFIIVGRGIYAAPDPIAAVKHYQKESWDAYLARTNQN